MNGNENHDDDTPWSELNHDVLILVMMQLGVVDFLSFSGVCKSWRSLVLSNWKRFMVSRPPLSFWISTDANEKEECYLYLKDFDGRKFKTILPHYVGRKCVGLTCGYLAFYVEETHDFWLVNPIIRHQLHFPHVPFDFKARDYLGEGLILVFSPSIPGWVLAVANRSVDRKIWCSIEGEGAWNHVPSPFRIIDFHAFNGKIYTLTYSKNTRYKFGLHKMRLNPRPKLKLLETKNLPDPSYLRVFVSSGENLYMWHYISKDWYGFYELDFGEMKWVSREKTRKESYTFFSRSLFIRQKCVLKPESWTGPWLKYVRYDDTNNSRKDGFYTANMWYFPMIV